MKSLILTLTLGLMSTHAFAAVACGQGEYDLVTIVQHEFDLGTQTAVDLNIAKLNYDEARYACGGLSKQDFCTEALTLAKKVVDVRTAELSAGVTTVPLVIEAQKELREIEKSCRTP